VLGVCPIPREAIRLLDASSPVEGVAQAAPVRADLGAEHLLDDERVSTERLGLVVR